MSAADSLDLNITEIGFVLHRPPNPSWRIERLANRDYCVLAFITGGAAVYTLPGERTVRKGDLVFFPRGMEHSAHSVAAEPVSYYSVAFAPCHSKPENQALQGLPHFSPCHNYATMLSLFRALERVWSAREPGYRMQCRGILLQIFGLFARGLSVSAANHPQYERIRRIAGYILDHYDQSFPIEQLADMAELSPSHFRALFKQVTGLTAVQYQNQVKINHARDLLASGECNVTQAALSVGYSDIFYFSRIFKKMTGTNPSDYVR